MVARDLNLPFRFSTVLFKQIFFKNVAIFIIIHIASHIGVFGGNHFAIRATSQMGPFYEEIGSPGWQAQNRYLKIKNV